MGFLAPAAAVAASAMAAAYTPPAAPDIVRWATENIVFDERSPLPGPFDIEKFPFLKEPLACLSPDHPAREVTLRGDAQWGKTTSIIHPTLGQWLEYAPIDVLVVHPTTSAAKEWVLRKWMPLRRQAPALRRMFGTGGGAGLHADTMGNQESLDLTRSLKTVSAGSPSDLTQSSRKLVVMDDLAKFDASDKGDPEAMAESRASGYEDAKILRASTAMLKGTCRITRALERSDFRLFEVPCPHCRASAPLTWENYLPSITPENLMGAHFHCEACGGVFEQKHKEKMVAAGRWKATNERGDHPGFHLWGRAYAPQRDWSSIAIDYAKAFGLTKVSVSNETATSLKNASDSKPEQTFYNDVLGLPYEMASSAPPWETIRDRVENAHPDDQIDRARIPAGGAMLTAGVDCQEDRTEVHIKAFGRKVRAWTVDYIVIPHKIDADECRQELDRLLTAKWRTAKGQDFPLDMLAIDGGTFTNDVWDWAKSHPWSRVIIVKGARSQTGPPYQLMKFDQRADGKWKKRQKRGYMVNVSYLKGEFYGYLAQLDPQDRGYCGFPVGLGDEFYRQLTAETRTTSRSRTGVMESKWDLVEPTRRNEALDTEIYARVAAMRLGWRAKTDEQWDDLEAIWGAPAPDGQPDLFDDNADVPPVAEDQSRRTRKRASDAFA